MILYGLKNCDTCRKALKLLPDAVFKDVRTDGLSAGVLKSAYAQFGADLINMRSMTWRGLNAEERLSDPLALLRQHPALMKRPLIIRDSEFFLGWTKDVQTELLG